MNQSEQVVVGFSGGITSAWCAAWALRTYSPEQVTFLFHDTQEEDPDTYRFIADVAARLGHPVTEQSDGRSVTEVCQDEGGKFRVHRCRVISEVDLIERGLIEAPEAVS